LLWIAKTDAEARARSIVTTHEARGWAIVPVSVKRKVPVELAPQLDVVRGVQIELNSTCFGEIGRK
jgi:hypothetical protein